MYWSIRPEEYRFSLNRTQPSYVINALLIVLRNLGRSILASWVNIGKRQFGIPPAFIRHSAASLRLSSLLIDCS